MIRTLLVLFLLAAPASAAVVVQCDPDAVVPSAVVAVHRSAHTPDFEGRGGAVINPDLSGVEGVLVRYWRCTALGAVVAMTQAQRDTLDAAAAAAQEQAQESSVLGQLDQDLAFRALALVVLDETNRLRSAICTLHPAACAQLPEITPQQLRDRFLAKYREITP